MIKTTHLFNIIVGINTTEVDATVRMNRIYSWLAEARE